MRRLAGILGVAAVVIGGFAAVGSGQGTGINRMDIGRGGVRGDYTVRGAGGTDVVVQKVTMEPGAATPWHTHPGDETAIVVAGTLTILRGDDANCAPRHFTAGQVMLGADRGHVHQAKNLGQQPLELVITYFNVPKGGQVASPAERPSHCPQ